MAHALSKKAESYINFCLSPPIVKISNQLIEDFKKIKDKWYFKTKGDNSWAPDGCFKIKEKTDNYIFIEFDKGKIIYVPETEVLGVVIKKIPFNKSKHQFNKNPNFLLDINKFERMEVKVFLKK